MRQFLILSLLLASIATSSIAQNRSFITNLALGVGNSGFEIENQNDGDLKRIYYPTGGIQIQTRISDNWAINIYPNVGMSGNKIVLDNPMGSITELRTRSAFVNLSVHPKYYLNESIYFSLGPEVAYLIWNYGSTYNGEERLSNREETAFFNRFNLLASASVGLSKKVGESRKNAPVQIDALWFVELRAKQGITNILDKDAFETDVSSRILSFELVTGISFASKK